MGIGTDLAIGLAVSAVTGGGGAAYLHHRKKKAAETTQAQAAAGVITNSMNGTVGSKRQDPGTMADWIKAHGASPASLLQYTTLKAAAASGASSPANQILDAAAKLDSMTSKERGEYYYGQAQLGGTFNRVTTQDHLQFEPGDLTENSDGTWSEVSDPSKNHGFIISASSYNAGLLEEVGGALGDAASWVGGAASTVAGFIGGGGGADVAPQVTAAGNAAAAAETANVKGDLSAAANGDVGGVLSDLKSAAGLFGF